MSTQTVMRVPEWTFGDRIRKIRRDVGLTQGEFAERIGRGAKAVAAWESGKSQPEDVVAVAKRIQLTMGVPAEWTLGLRDSTISPDGGGGVTVSYPQLANVVQLRPTAQAEAA